MTADVRLVAAIADAAAAVAYQYGGSLAAVPDAVIAEILNAPSSAQPRKLASRRIGAGTIIEAMGIGPTGGGAFLSKLRGWAASSSTIPAPLAPFQKDIAEILPVIDRGDLEIGSAPVRTMLDSFVALGEMTAAQAAALKALGEGDHLSWAEANGVAVNARAVGLARGGN